MKILWDENHELAGFAGAATDIPDWAFHVQLAGDDIYYLSAAVVMSGLRKLDRPVWLHPRAAEHLVAVDILDEWDDEPVMFDGVQVRLFAGPM